MTIVKQAKEVNQILFDVQNDHVSRNDTRGHFISESDFNRLRRLFVDHLLDAASFDFSPSADLSNSVTFDSNREAEIKKLVADIEALTIQQSTAPKGPSRSLINNQRQQLEGKLIRLRGQ